MSINILMPALSPTMTEGKLAKWLKQEGDEVHSGDVLAEIETDKATMEVEAVEEGTLGKILVAAGSEGIPVNTPIAILLEEGEDASALDKAAEAKPATAASAPAPAASPAPAAAPAPAGNRPAAASGGRVFASPLARRLAKEAGLDLTAISGSGPRGRIIKADIEAAIAAGTGKAKAPEAAKPAAKEAAPAKAAPPPATANYIEVPNSTMRKVIAQRLAQSKREAPHFYLSIDCNIDALMAMREQLNARTPEGDGAFKISVNDFVVRAVALAMRAFPDVNCSWTEDAIRYYQTVDVSVAVSTPSGLITPVVRNADMKGLAAISNEVKQLAKRARDGKLTPEEYQGGGFTISNLGMYGITNFAAVINPPQSCLLAVGAAEKRPIVKDNALAIATMMSCTLSIDHRSVDGAKGAEFLQVLKKLVEDPLRMML
ncbi:pyruvate dehydrogenase complex dihydrolipoamide acetyltransferase [Defluviicoccus vanus]|uniref:Acetyltransferase component of pyruvate dehydrogenase complex n=1 Tax=Defluviicoccus vanus TaxID=111831 RepID=A0A7H1MXS1_9PROT|nr:pyruvate dehydrogenase complex dihydrolipoamide acetyltransferase [Defluviicoccus vanus]QNT68257.1 pyruvate dehydrogenase complex dihydrolipoamide acetyltransferase [Defluviicoccus vanus]